MPQQTQMDITQAMDILNRLKGVAPPSTADKLGQIIGLVQGLSDENAYLNALMYEDVPPPRPQPVEDSPAQASEDFLNLLQSIRPEAPPEPEPEAPAEPVVAAPPESVMDLNMLHDLSDSLRPPLVAIRGRAELVQAGFLGQITSEQDHWLQAVQENTERAFAILDAVQEMISLERDEIVFDAVNFLATDLMSEAMSRVRDRSKQFKHEMTLQAPPNVPLVRGDFYRTLIVLTDILDNAIRYTATGGDIRLSLDNLGTHVLFSVVDTGVGLSPADLENIGKPFWRGEHNRLVRQHNGTGLRLCLAKEILARQGGELIFSGEPGVGSTFSFTLPAPSSV